MRSYEETKKKASDTLDEMYYEVSVLYRTYNKYLKHGAVNAADKLKKIIEDKEMEIKGEEDMFNLAFN